MSRLLTFDTYLGGADNVQVVEMFPRNRAKYDYNFGAPVNSHVFSGDYQSIVIDTMTTGGNDQPNFNASKVIGYFSEVGTISDDNIDTSRAADNIVRLIIPEDRYTGQLLPNADKNIVITIVSFQWTSVVSDWKTDVNGPDSASTESNLHRFAIIERWEPGVEIGDPTEERDAQGGFVSLDTSDGS